MINLNNQTALNWLCQFEWAHAGKNSIFLYNLFLVKFSLVVARWLGSIENLGHVLAMTFTSITAFDKPPNLCALTLAMTATRKWGWEGRCSLLWIELWSKLHIAFEEGYRTEFSLMTFVPCSISLAHHDNQVIEQ